MSGSDSSDSSSSKSGGVACLDRGCYAQVVYGTDYPECYGAMPGELWMVMTNDLFKSTNDGGLNDCLNGDDISCNCPMQPGCYKIEDPDNWTVGEFFYMQCVGY